MGLVVLGRNPAVHIHVQVVAVLDGGSLVVQGLGDKVSGFSLNIWLQGLNVFGPACPSTQQENVQSGTWTPKVCRIIAF